MSNNASAVQFMMVSELEEIIFNPARREPLQFEDKSAGLRLAIKSKHEDGTMGAGSYGLVCHSYCDAEVSHQHAEFVSNLIAGRYLSLDDTPLQLPAVVKGEELISATGELAKGILVPFELIPTALQMVCLESRNRLSSFQERFVRLIRWRQDIDAPHFVHDRSPSLYWRVRPSDVEHADSNYYLAPLGRQRGAGVSPRGIIWTSEHEAAFADVWGGQAAESLGHELLREAFSSLSRAPRSALLMAATAAETGVKNHIGRVSPQASWLIHKIPSPPMFRILRDYLPTLHTATTSIADWNALKGFWKRCEKLFEDRNALTHAGQPPTFDAIYGHLNTAHDLLYLLDVLEGNSWAMAFVSYELINELGWPASKDGGRFHTTMESGSPLHELVPKDRA